MSTTEHQIETRGARRNCEVAEVRVTLESRVEVRRRELRGNPVGTSGGNLGGGDRERFRAESESSQPGAKGRALWEVP